MTQRAWLFSLLLIALISMPLSVAHAGVEDAGVDAPVDARMPRDAPATEPDAPENDAAVDDAGEVVGEDGAISLDGGVDEDAPVEETDTGTPVGHDSGPIVPVPPSDGCSCSASSPTAPSGLMLGGLALGLALASRRRR
jgi:MYXO-CTERM domain-containing protein